MIHGKSIARGTGDRWALQIGEFACGYERYGAALALGGAFFLPLKLAIAYIFIIPLTLLWVVRLWRERRFPSLHSPPNRALLFFLITAALTSLAGLDPLRSTAKIARFAFYGCTVFAFAELRGANVLKILGALMLGQTIAALDSVINAAFPALPGLFLGKVSESGQLCMTTIVSIGVVFALNRQILRACTREQSGAWVRRYRQERGQAVLLGALNFLLLLSFSFAATFGITGAPFLIVMTAALSGPLLGLLSAIQLGRLKMPHLSRIYFFIACTLPLLTTALLVNLKRGPWFGILIGGAVFMFIHARRLLTPLIAAGAILLVTIAPLRNRLAASSEHFFISGGRQAIWDVGGELSLRYPLGIGYENSRVLRQFAPEIPPELVHFHNNILQVLVELGWFGLGIYLWWIAAVIRLAFRPHPSRSERLVCTAIGCAVIGWQSAGLVEYNLGDSEVALVAFLLIGLLIKLKLPRGKAPRSNLIEPREA